MPNIELSWLKFALFIVALFGGFTLTVNLADFWPYIYPSTLWAFTLMGFSIAMLVVASGAHGGLRSGLIAVAVLTALASSVVGLYELANLGVVALKTMNAWRHAGATPVKAFNAGLWVIHNLTPAQARANMTCAFVGLPPLVLLAGAALAAIAGSSRNRISKGGPWRARWMDDKQIRYLQSLTFGLPLGLKNGSLLRYEPNPAKGWRAGHHAAIAGTRAGKGVSVVIPAIIDHDGPVVVLDVKGENFAVTRRWRQSLGRRVVVLNPFGLIEPAKDGFNPLDYIRPSQLVRDIDVIAEGLVRPEAGAGSHFSALATQIIAAAIEVVTTREEPKKRNLNTVADILFSADFDQRLRHWMDEPETYGRRPAQAAAMLLTAGENERGGVKTTIKKAFEWARSDDMRSFLAASTVNFDDLLDDRIDIFVAVPLDQLDAQAIFMRLLINMILGTVVRQDGRRSAKNRILMVLDEFVRLGRMEKLLNIANVAAGAGVEALFVTQDKGQIETVYGKGDTDSLLGSCVTTRIFGLGRAESNTAEWAADALGDQTILTESRQMPTKMGERPRISTNEHKQKLMTSDQILEMPADEMLCLIGSQPPLRLKALLSYAYPAYKAKLDPNPARRA